MILYLLFNKSINKYYIGTTNNLDRRIKEHNQETGHFTGKVRGVWELVGCKSFDNSFDALREEKRLKKAKKRDYIRWYFNLGP